MADPTTTNKVLILLGDGATPEVFGAPCGGNVVTVNYTNNTGEAVVMDCTNPLTVVPAIQRWTESQDTTLTISGRLSLEALELWRTWADSGAAKNCRVLFDHNLANDGGYHGLPAILQSLEVSRSLTATAEVTATIVGAGRRAWTPAAS